MLDTNTVVSGLLWHQAPAQLIHAALHGRVELFVTPTSIASTSRDPEDDHVLACALAAQADLIVSGDADFLGLKAYQGIPVVTAAEALTRLAQP